MKNNRNDTIIAWFGALCFFLSAIEYMIPKPMPWLRIGLTNLPVMLAIDILPLPSFCILILIKVLGQGLIGGTIFSYIFLFSTVGTTASAIIMLLLRKTLKGSVSWVGISVAGAFASNAAQLTLARWYIFGESAWYIAPPFIAVGAVTGCALGIFANHFAANSRWYADIKEHRIEPEDPRATISQVKKTCLWRSPFFRFPTGVALLLALLFIPNIMIQAGIALFAIVLLVTDRSRLRLFPIIVMSASIILFNLFAPFGKILARPFSFPVTEGALLLGIKKALTVEGMIFISRWMTAGGLRLPGKPGQLVSEAFQILGKLTQSKKKLDPKNLISSIDAIMYERG